MGVQKVAAPSTMDESTFTAVARSLGGSAALSLIAGVLAPQIGVIAGAAVIGLVGGYLAKNVLD